MKDNERLKTFKQKYVILSNKKEQLEQTLKQYKDKLNLIKERDNKNDLIIELEGKVNELENDKAELAYITHNQRSTIKGLKEYLIKIQEDNKYHKGNLQQQLDLLKRNMIPEQKHVLVNAKQEIKPIYQSNNPLAFDYRRDRYLSSIKNK